MTNYIVKVALTAVLVVSISEIGKRSSFVAALLASLPLTSVLALIWLHLDTQEKNPVADLSMSIFWMVIPSLVFFPILAYSIRHLHFWLALLLSIGCTVGTYSAFIWGVGRLGIKL